MKIALYGNGSSGNHGCEAIVRGTVELLGSEINSFRIQSKNPQEDQFYGLEALAQVCPAKSERKKDLRFLTAYSRLKLTGNYTDMDGLSYLPGVSIGDNCVIGAGSVVSKNIPSGSIAVGNPIRIVDSYEDFVEKHKAQMKQHPVFSTFRADKSDAEKADMKSKLADGIGYDK